MKKAKKPLPAGRTNARPAPAAAKPAGKINASKQSTKKRVEIEKSPAVKGRNDGAVKDKRAVPAVAAKSAAGGAEPVSNGKKGATVPKVQSLGRGKRTRTVAEAASSITADSKGYVFINGRRVRMISTKGQLPPKKIRSNGSENSAAETIDQPSIKSIKTKLSRKELNHYRDLLLTKRRDLVGDLNAMETEALRSGGGNLSHMPIHMADIGTDTFDQDFMLGLAANERDHLREIDGALQRIEDRTYGVCQMTGKPIPKARLDAKPWAKNTIEAARKLEGQWNR